MNDVPFENTVVAEFTGQGMTNQIRGTAIGSQTSITKYTRYQKYFDLSIPLLIAYNQPIGKGFSLSFAGGINYNFYQLTKGETYESEFSFGTYDNLESLNYKSNGLIEGIAQFGISKEIGKSWSFNAGVAVQQDLNSRLNSSVVASDKFSSRGLYVGVTRRL